jgi:hypothetical protein
MEFACVKKLRADSVRRASEALLLVGTKSLFPVSCQKYNSKMCRTVIVPVYMSIDLTLNVSENGLKKEELLCN